MKICYFSEMVVEESLISKINTLPPSKISEVVDFVDFLTGRESNVWKAERSASIAAYASEFGGTEYDLDEALEAASVETLLAIDGEPN